MYAWNPPIHYASNPMTNPPTPLDRAMTDNRLLFIHSAIKNKDSGAFSPADITSLIRAAFLELPLADRAGVVALLHNLLPKQQEPQ